MVVCGWVQVRQFSLPRTERQLSTTPASRYMLPFKGHEYSSGGFKTALEFSFERDWPITDESGWFCEY
jgi:hypothetical protein